MGIKVVMFYFDSFHLGLEVGGTFFFPRRLGEIGSHLSHMFFFSSFFFPARRLSRVRTISTERSDLS